MPGTPPRHAPDRTTTRPGARRGRRPTARTAGAIEPVVAPGSPPEVHAAARSRVISGLALSLTHRIIAITAVLAVLAVSYVSVLSVYFGQQADIAQAKADILASQQQVASLQDQLKRWQDPAFVEAQARDRLGWVMPGEIGYRVIDANGNVIGGTVASLDVPPPAPPPIWYDALLASLLAADQPTVPR